MKPYKVINVALRDLFLFKKIWLFGCLYSLVIIYGLLQIANTRKGFIGIYDLVADVSGLHGSTNQNMFMILGIPLILTFITLLTNRVEKSHFAILTGTRFRLWHVLAVSSIFLSFVLTCLVILISLFFGAAITGTQNTWISPQGTIAHFIHNQKHFGMIVSNVSTIKVLLTIFITKFLGFTMISFLALFLKHFIKQTALVLIILIGLAGLDLYGIDMIPVFTRIASLNLQDWINPWITIYHCVYMFIVCLVLYGVTGLLYERKEFLS